MIEWLNTKETRKTLVDDELCLKKMWQQYQGSILVAWHINYISVAMDYGSNLCSVHERSRSFFPSFIAGDISGTNANYHAQLQESKRHHYWSYIKQTGGRAMSFTIRNCLVHRAVSLCIRMPQPCLSVPGKWTNMNNTHFKSFSESKKTSTITHQMICTKGTDAFPHFQ